MVCRYRADGLSAKRLALLLLALLLAGDLFPASVRASSAYTRVAEIPTSVPLPATVCWLADANALEAAKQGIRPASAWVFLDASLRVLERSGKEIAPSLTAYLDAAAPYIIPVLQPLDEASADALHKLLAGDERKDIFVAADWENADWLNRFTALPHIRGIVDYTGMDWSSEDILSRITARTNRAGAKVALIPGGRATRALVRALQSRLITVWASSGSDRVSLLTTLTAGVNGLVVGDYHGAVDAISFFQEDAPVLLRTPFIIGHRGMPSEYVENTLPGARGAYNAGADMIENDVWLSRDGELFINHDQTLKRLFDRGDIASGEDLTLEQLKGIPFSHEGMSGVPASNNQPAAKSRYGFFPVDPSLRIPALKEYFEAFRDTDIVHFVEIKSHNPAIVPALKALSETMGTAGQLVVISFNTNILEAMKREWPELSVGALGSEGLNLGDGRPGFLDYGSIIRFQSAEAALERLFAVLQPYNATYNPKSNFTYELARAGRHRGLTVWPWTYNEPQAFAKAWLGGVNGLTTNFAWWASDLVTEVAGEDERLPVGAALSPPTLITQKGAAAPAGDCNAIAISGDAVKDGIAVKAGEAVLLWRVRQRLLIGGKNFGAYYLYSQPFQVWVE
ncbi:MAG: glycerophosphodiester phosphodiesterase [Eubacteriales bacterium]|nr:glycerophosphodiester phosphodiesterase [Eubacteriales bacterium]